MSDLEPTNALGTTKDNLVENARRVLSLCNTPDQVVGFYDKWVNFNEQVSNAYESVQPIFGTIIDKYLPNEKYIKILDIGAGTGIIGRELKNYGFGYIDGLDPSEAMLKQAQETKIYSNVYLTFMNAHVPCLQTNSYDCIVSKGAFGGPQIGPEALPEVIRCLKPGGIACIITRTEYVSPDSSLGKEMRRLETEERLWQLLEDTIVPYIYNLQGTMLVFKITKMD